MGGMGGMVTDGTGADGCQKTFTGVRATDG